MENAIGIRLGHKTSTKGRLVHKSESSRAKTEKRPSILEWYQILRMHHHWTIFQAIRFALWLAR